MMLFVIIINAFICITQKLLVAQLQQQVACQYDKPIVLSFRAAVLFIL